MFLPFLCISAFNRVRNTEENKKIGPQKTGKRRLGHMSLKEHPKQEVGKKIAPLFCFPQWSLFSAFPFKGFQLCYWFCQCKVFNRGVTVNYFAWYFFCELGLYLSQVWDSSEDVTGVPDMLSKFFLYAIYICGNHRIIEYFRLEGTLTKII